MWFLGFYFHFDISITLLIPLTCGPSYKFGFKVLNVIMSIYSPTRSMKTRVIPQSMSTRFYCHEVMVVFNLHKIMASTDLMLDLVLYYFMCMNTK